MANKFNISQLLNNTSRGVSGEGKNKVESNRPLKIVQISVHDLVPSKDNFYSMQQIEELKTAIELVGGIKQNLNVSKLENGKYKVLAGHRRRLASISLVEEGKKEYEFLPCAIEASAEDEELNQIKEELLLILTNSQRDKTDWDKLEEAKRLKAILERYKKKEKLSGRIRDIIAEILNTSPTQIGRMDAISNNLTQDFKEELKEEKINMSTAYELSGLEEQNQIEVFEEYKEKGSLTIKDVKQKKEELDKLNNEVEEKLNEEYEDLSGKYKKIEAGEVDLIEGEAKEVEADIESTIVEVRSGMIYAKYLLEQTNIELNKLPCECNSYSGYECSLHDWKNRVARLVDEISDGIEDEE